MGCKIVVNAAKTTKYKVSGDTLKDIWADIEKKGPQDPNDKKRVAAITSTEIAVSSKWKEEVRDGKCMKDGSYQSVVGVKDMTMTLSSTIKLPSLGSHKLSKKAKKEWDRFSKKLEAHEKEHVAKAKKLAEQIAAEIMALTGVGVAASYEDSVAQGKASFLAVYSSLYNGKLLSARINGVHAEFDKKSKHGAKHGASLDTTIE